MYILGVLGGVGLVSVVCIVIFRMLLHKTKKKSDLIISSESFEVLEKPLEKSLEDGSQYFLDSMSSIAQSINLKIYKFCDCRLQQTTAAPAIILKDRFTVVNHSNLIRVSGACINDNWYPVYEYAANGALSDWIFNQDDSRKFLCWKHRIQMALDVATELNYLHSFSNS
ncbi:hypothetical protein V6N12_022058 [Hibiscus sabdariffa]|uniref:Protein kinase domain-containing protein n=1 Tax=Hibiscus sabdariffa TaxID=183260 RepID=A0ABR2FTQ7_9ROSI